MYFCEFLENKAKNEGINKLVVGAVITNENGEILLMKRKQDDFMGGIFEIPGGNAEEGESIYDILKRETEKKEYTVADIEGMITQYRSQFNNVNRQINQAAQQYGGGGQPISGPTPFGRP